MPWKLLSYKFAFAHKHAGLLLTLIQWGHGHRMSINLMMVLSKKCILQNVSTALMSGSAMGPCLKGRTQYRCVLFRSNTVNQKCTACCKQKSQQQKRYIFSLVDKNMLSNSTWIFMEFLPFLQWVKQQQYFLYKTGSTRTSVKTIPRQTTDTLYNVYITTRILTVPRHTNSIFIRDPSTCLLTSYCDIWVGEYILE